MAEVIHLSDLVESLKLRVEALERELAALKPKVPPLEAAPGPYLEQALRAELAAKWDAGTYSEKDFEHG